MPVCDDQRPAPNRSPPSQAPRVVLSSPVCYADAPENRWRELLDRDGLLQALDELLQAERAGAKVAKALRRAADDPAQAPLMALIHEGELHWCGVLLRAIGRLGASPSSCTGDFFDKVMAVPDLPGRLALLNRGQAWVVRKLEALLPRIEDDALGADLMAMLEAHRQNIARVDAQLAAPPA